MDHIEIERLVEQSADAATMLRALANQQRLLILCHLSAAGELSASALNGRMELSQSALSQHLARLREEGLVTFRRDAQTLIYRIADERVSRLLGLLHELYCPNLQPEGAS
ncbi:metalloregulator ArsR/SmtB family transcription factor [Sphingomonas sp.]|uniref:ArsR/SmtB family transcription factor n=1 Tax=Sphingomonas sp. TaxID=28214 RepID=UPI00286B7E0A|nr:metalloregulator ArsR/SmtB family transcription factor [Sphingomonas sp.]